VVPRHVEQRHVEPADQVLEIVERKIAAAQHQVEVQAAQLVAIQRLVDLVGDGEDSRGGYAKNARRA
jgi:hypothetical protein